MRKQLLPLILILLFFFTGCGERPVAVINGEEISREEFQAQFAQRLKMHELQGKKVDRKALKEAVLQEMIARRLLVQAAEDRGIEVTEQELKTEAERIELVTGRERLKETLKQWNLSESQYMQRLRESLMIKKLIEQLVPEDSITEEDMKKFYRESQRPFMSPARVQVRIIQVPTEQEAVNIYREWQNSGMDFDRFADMLREQNRAIVTEYGWVQPGLFSGVIKEALESLQEGETGGPYRGKDGYYIIRVKSREAERVLSFEEAKEQVRTMLLQQRRQAVKAHLVEERKKKADIKIFIN